MSPPRTEVDLGLKPYATTRQAEYIDALIGLTIALVRRLRGVLVAVVGLIVLPLRRD